MSGCKLSPVALGLAVGVFWGCALLVMGLMGYFSTYGQPFIAAVGTVYIGYEPTIQGSIIGALIGLVDGFVDAFIIAWLYNRFSCGKCGCCQPEVKVVS